MFKKLLCFSAAFILILSSFCIPSFAVSDNGLTFNNQPIPYSANASSLSYAEITALGFIWSKYDNGSTVTNNYLVSDTNDDIYLFYDSSDDPGFRFVCETQHSNVRVKAYSTTFNSNVEGSNNIYISAFDNDTGLYYSTKYSIISTSFYNYPNVPSYSTLSAGLLAIKDFIANPAPSPSSFTSHVSLEPGTVLYIGSTANNTVTINGSTRFPMRSTLLGGDFPDSSQTYAVVSSLPSTGTTFPLQYATRLPWVKDQPFNVLGQSFNAKIENFTINTPNQGFVSIHNPYFVNVEDFNAAGDLNTNSTLELDITGYTSLRIYPLQDEVLDSTSPDNFNTYWEGSSTDNGDGSGTVTWNPVSEDGSDVSNMGSNPNNMGINGGGNFDSTSILQQIKQTLDNFVSSFISVISAPISHIAELINAGSGFMSALRGLYAWLPVDIQGLVISALTLVIGIGVFKVFL